MKKCNTKLTITDCLAATAFKAANYSQSCVWRQYHTSSIVETQDFSTTKTNVFVPGLNYGNTLCGLHATVSLWPSSKNRWGAAVRLQGGPWDTTISNGYESPRMPAMSAGCVMSTRIGKNNCTMTVVPPTGYAAQPQFQYSAYSMDFFTSVSAENGWMARH